MLKEAFATCVMILFVFYLSEIALQMKLDEMPERDEKEIKSKQWLTQYKGLLACGIAVGLFFAMNACTAGRTERQQEQDLKQQYDEAYKEGYDKGLDDGIEQGIQAVKDDPVFFFGE